MSQGFESTLTATKQNSQWKPKIQEIREIGAIQKSLVQHFVDIKDPRAPVK